MILKAIEIKDTQYFDKIKNLFPANAVNHPMIFSALKHTSPGHLILEDKDNPKSCLLRLNWGMTFIGGKPSSDFVNKGIQQLREKGRVLLAIMSEEDGTSLIAPDRKLPRIAFDDFDFSNERFNEYCNDKLDGLIILEIDNNLLSRCQWKTEVMDAFGDKSLFLKNGLGFCLMKNNEILCEAYAFFFGLSHVEIGTVTSEKHLKKNYATLLCSHLIKICKERGFAPYWS